MENMTNDEMAEMIAKKLSHPNIDSFGDGDDEFDTRFYHACKDAALQAMALKDKQEIQFLQSLMFHATYYIFDRINERIKLLKGK